MGLIPIVGLHCFFIPGAFWRRLLHPAVHLAFFLALLLAVSVPAQAEPRYTAMYGQSCVLCHVNPTGGGMRTLYASQFLVPEELSRPVDGGEDSALFNPEVSPGLVLGADLRTLMYQREGGAGSVFSMQGDLYLQAQVSSGVTIYLEQGQSRAGEIFGIAHLLPLDGYVKAGRFIPDHGWKWADHQMFNRRYLHEPGGTEDPSLHFSSGFEVGISPGMFLATASILEGSRGDPDQRLGENYAAKAMIMQGLGPLNLGLGASVLRRANFKDHLRAAGGFWYVGAGPVVWLGQMDETRQQGNLGNLVAQEVTIRFARGTDLRLTYGFQDPDRAHKTGARHRSGAGVAVMPAPFFTTQVMINRWNFDQGSAVTDQDYTEAEIMAHFFF
jgi:hypothetical protein